MTILEQLTSTHDAVLMDAMGVLIDRLGAIDGAPQYVHYLNQQQKNYFILTNICSDSEVGIYTRLRKSGISLSSPEQIISAGSLLKRYLSDTVLAESTVAYIGPESCRDAIDTGKHELVAGKDATQIDVLALLDDEGFCYRETLESALTACVKKFEHCGELPLLLLANSDSVYPRECNSYAFGSGVFASMMSEALYKLLGVEPETICFGKPSSRMFIEAQRRSKVKSLLMIGDQIATDILGANNSGITSALVLTGLNSQPNFNYALSTPDYVIDNLHL